jgi:hypothetical protein
MHRNELLRNWETYSQAPVAVHGERALPRLPRGYKFEKAEASGLPSFWPRTANREEAGEEPAASRFNEWSLRPPPFWFRRRAA